MHSPHLSLADASSGKNEVVELHEKIVVSHPRPTRVRSLVVLRAAASDANPPPHPPAATNNMGTAFCAQLFTNQPRDGPTAFLPVSRRHVSL